MRDLELYPPCRIGFDQIDEFPWNGSRRYSLQRRLERVHGNHALEQPANRSARTHIDRCHFQAHLTVFGLWMKVDVVYPDNFATVNIYDLLVEKVTLESEQSLTIYGMPLRSR